MMEKQFEKMLKINPVIAAVKKKEALEKAVKSDCRIVFLLGGTISSLGEMIESVRSSGKMVFIHVDLIDGLGRDAAAIKYLGETFKPDGIISTKNQLLRAAKKEGLLTIQRFFLLDSISLQQCLKISAESDPTAIEIMPGVMPEIIREISEQIHLPVIVGGLVRKKTDIENALQNGALGVSATEAKLWSV